MSADEKMYYQKLRNYMNISKCFPCGPTQIFDFLYIGGQDEATDLPLLSKLGITHVINCASGYVFFIVIML